MTIATHELIVPNISPARWLRARLAAIGIETRFDARHHRPVP
jgi:hypothetical protein